MSRKLKFQLLTLLAIALAVAGISQYWTSGVEANLISVPRVINSPVGSWYGIARPIVPETSPFPEVVMTPTFLADGNFIANDSHEFTNPHVTSHGNWVYTGRNQIRAVFIWMNLTGDANVAPNGFVGTMRVILEGKISEGSPDSMEGTVHAFFYPPDANPLDPAVQGVDLGIFQIDFLTRIRADK